MPKIVHLSNDVVEKIAAGEVIERPAFAVKELVENSIDAKASLIEITLEKGGLEKIKITDNGIGMNKDDLQLSFLAHTTSKLKTIDDLYNIKTLGFRGEALSSIAAVSKLVIQSRPSKSIAGNKVEIKEGKVLHASSIGMPVGTTIVVSDLFKNIPARKKFLKSEKSEYRIILDFLLGIILAHPHIHFVLKHNDKTIFDIPKTKDLAIRLSLLLGEVTSQLLPFKNEEGYLSLSGFIGTPQAASSISKQYIFVNGRIITDKIITLAVKEAFGTLLPAKSLPVFVIFLSLPTHIIDVNIHPRKETIQFTDNSYIFEVIKTTILETLQKHNIIFNLAKFKNETSEKQSETQTISAQLLKEQALLDGIETLQIHKTYIFAPSKNGVTIIDQHAAHERILFEKLTTQFEKRKNASASFQLPNPLTLSLGLSEIELLTEHKDLFKQLGFQLEAFQGTAFVIRAVPEVFKGRNIKKILDDLFSDLVSEIPIKRLDIKSLRLLAFLACRAAIKAGDALNAKQQETLIQELETTKNNTTCPHGRPTKIFFSKQYLDTQFKR